MLDNQPIIRSAGAAGAESNETSTVVLLPDRQIDQGQLESALKPFTAEFKCFGLVSALPTQFDVYSFVELLASQLAVHNIKRITLLAIGSGAAVAQAFAVRFPKVVRRVVLIDAETRVAPSFAVRLIDRIEKVLPLGLPLRSLTNSFDSRSFLHRIRCPVLVLQTPGANRHMSAQFELICRQVPNAWGRILSGPSCGASGEISPEVADLVRTFVQTPTKRPKK